MSSKKHRKQLRIKRINELFRPAAWIFFKEEDRRMYLEETKHISEIADTLSAQDVVMLSRIAWSNSWGRAFNNLTSFDMGFDRLNFRYQSKGKVHARNIHCERQ